VSFNTVPTISGCGGGGERFNLWKKKGQKQKIGQLQHITGVTLFIAQLQNIIGVMELPPYAAQYPPRAQISSAHQHI
jgi:hypothetical protein